MLLCAAPVLSTVQYFTMKISVISEMFHTNKLLLRLIKSHHLLLTLTMQLNSRLIQYNMYKLNNFISKLKLSASNKKNKPNLM